MISAPRPILLLADSRLLFLPEGRAAVRSALGRESVRLAAYVGASNGDLVEYYEIFRAAMSGFGVDDSCMVSSAFDDRDAALLESADLVLLSGGDVATGWKVFSRTRMADALRQRHRSGATLIGVSAGAVLLGQFAMPAAQDGAAVFKLLRLCPFVVDVHDERQQWKRLVHTMRALDVDIEGLGIRTGGGALCWADGRIDAIRTPADYFRSRGGDVTCRVLSPA
ncbi:MAG TPA: Type 1 glutamine amidotransferase-like domain-containing protein [Vicinamibacterales bacterium]|nr:Type 1 glutamine amidotransferase-like domain-containing protein [Vicinamibacterales bacterium]